MNRQSDNYSSAGLGRRLGAILYDTLLLFGVLFAAVAILLPFTGGEAIAPGNHLLTAYLVIVTYLFFGWCWTRTGQTLGMQAWKIRIESDDGTNLTWQQTGLRLSAALLSWLAFGLGYWWVLFSPARQSWHDLLSRSRTIRVAPAP